MESGSLEKSSCSELTASNETDLPSSNDLMEDTDSQSTRKRPRLDSGNNSLESIVMSTHTSTDDDGRQTEPTTVNSSTPPPPSQPPTPQRPSSRVTINMKSPPTSDSNTMSDGKPDAVTTEENRTSSCTPEKEQNSSENSAQATRAISIASSLSPAQSVKIEVAELEDMNDGPSTSNWRSLGEALQAPSLAEEVVEIHEPFYPVDMFPRIHSDVDGREAVDEIRSIIEKGSIRTPTILITVKRWFEECVANLDRVTYEVVVDDRDFWEEIPGLVEALMRRESKLLPNDGQGPWLCLRGFCVSYAEIALHFIRQDTILMRNHLQDPKCPLDMISKMYWSPLTWMIQLKQIPFYKVMESEFGVEVPNLISQINDSLCRPELKSLSAISDFAMSLLELLPQWPALAPNFTTALTFAARVIGTGCDTRKLGIADQLIDSSAFDEVVKQGYEFFRAVDSAYQTLIGKKATWLAGDISEPIFRAIGSTHFEICSYDHEFAVKIAQDLGINFPEGTPPEDYAQMVWLGWKFKTLKKFITEGRMELRVGGVETMQLELVNVWKQHMSGNPAGIDYPVTKLLINFLRDNKVVEYIVGVDSHPQLISRSGNIVGFLIVTHTYTDQDTNNIWNTVIESHDPRTVQEVLAMLSGTFSMHPAGSSALLYLCKKLLELPLNRFDSRMLEYCNSLLDNFRSRLGHRGRPNTPDYSFVDIVPLRLCVRLIREITSVQDIPPEQKSQLRSFASRHLFHFIEHGINDRDKMELFGMCIKDISEMNELAIGSIHALVSLLCQPDKDIRQLAMEFNFTTLIINELAHALTSDTADFTGLGLNDFICRMHLLQQIVDKIPETITPDLADKLWDSLFSSKTLSNKNRGLAWEVLSKSTMKCGKRNSFLERCMNEYFPRVLPDDFTEEVLSFAEQAVTYDISFSDRPPLEEDKVVSVPGMDRIWHIILMAPSPELGMKAINFAIEVYLDNPMVRNAPRTAAEATHVSLVDRCVDQLRSAANRLKSFVDGTTSGEDEPMVIVPSGNEVQVEELKFARSLLFLKQLLHGLRTRPLYIPPQGSPPVLPLRSEERRGELIQISYQAFDGTEHTQIRTLQCGDLTTLGQLSQRLSGLTGFAKFDLITGGRFLDQCTNGNRTLRDLRVPTSGLLIVRKIAGVLEGFGGRRQSLTLVDSEVIKHFDALYDFLNLDERLSKSIFDFLVLFPPQQRVRECVRSADIPESEMFPLDKPYKLLYSITSLIACVREEALETQPDQEFISRTIRNLAAFLLRTEMSESLDNSPLKLTYASHFIECFLPALSAKSIAENAEPFFPDPTGLVKCLLRFVFLRSTPTQPPIAEMPLQKLVANSFATLLEASMHDSRLWDAFKESTNVEDIILTLLLREPSPNVRQDIAAIIFSLCGSTPSQKQSAKDYYKEPNASAKLESLTGIDIVGTLWKALTSLIPHSIEFPETSQQFFEVALVVFYTVGNLSPDDLIFGDYLKDWGRVLLQHQSQGFVGREPIDHIVLGFAHLLKQCVELSKTRNITENTKELLEQLFTAYLFPHLSERFGTAGIEPLIPVMHSGTRQELYNVLLLLCEDEVNLKAMLGLLIDIIPSDFSCDTNWVFDRTKTIRSPEGYAGLRNLSNTCYLNSLFTQLFMNINFRKFMMEVPTTTSSQKLLVETKKLFSYMQNTWQKSVDTLPTVEAIRTFENEMIDINIQMDVDEFYNLLFDRWEGQIQSVEDKRVFRSFYGGQLVQQIKSKECEHISERLEPFSAIQCEIKGKSGLEESLKAYVEGEMMQGDNKYSCTSCNRHVDAVKRACLKDLPDNLIFHLKRFDFDVISMMRSKINDEFHFPERIDMTPYKVEYLSDPDAAVDSDVFELVGVLVHSGTAESGHYYSYIKERPSLSPGSWVEFNDADVSRFDPGKIADQCFGGTHDTFPGANMGQVRFNKVWNAYMLFYQRVSSMEQAKADYQMTLTDKPVTVPLPRDLGNHIAMENELFLRTYCLLDPYYARFVHGLLERCRQTVLANGAKPSAVQKAIINVTLDTMDQLVSRTKETQILEQLFAELDQAAEDNMRATYWILEWATTNRSGVRDLLLRCPLQFVRGGFSTLTLSCLVRFKRWISDPSLDQARATRHTEDYTILVDNLLENLHQLWVTVHLYSRAWDDYFDLILKIARLGTFEVEVVLENGFLLKCLEIIWLDRDDEKKLKFQYANYYRMIDKGRKFSFVKLMELLAFLFSHIDWTITPFFEPTSRPSNDGKFAMSVDEADLICPIGRHKDLVLLRKIIEQQANPDITRRLIQHFVELPASHRLLDGVLKAIEEGLAVDPSSYSVPFLEASLVFCEYAPDPDKVLELVDFSIKCADNIDDAAAEYLGYLRALLRLQNQRISQDESWFTTLVTERISEWAPALLLVFNSAVRTATFELLQQLLFSKITEDLPLSHQQFNHKVGRELGIACLEKLRGLYAGETPSDLRVNGRILEATTEVASLCLELFFNDNDLEDQQIQQQAADVFAAIEQMTADLPDEFISGSDFPSDAWDNESMVASDSDLGLPGSP